VLGVPRVKTIALGPTTPSPGHQPGEVGSTPGRGRCVLMRGLPFQPLQHSAAAGPELKSVQQDTRVTSIALGQTGHG